jgi:hypothetical protein
MYKATSPIATETPAIPPRIRFPEDGIPSPEVSAKAIRNPAPISCEITTTLYTLPRLVARPPLKSPDPQHAAEVKPNAIANTSELIISADALRIVNKVIPLVDGLHVALEMWEPFNP